MRSTVRSRCVLVPLIVGAAAGVASADAWRDGWTEPSIGGGSHGSRGDTSPVIDPLGDVADLGFGGPLTDLASIHLWHTATDLHFELSFHTPIAPMSAGAPESLFGYTELDVDRNPSTGFAPFQNAYGVFDVVSFGTDFAINHNDAGHPGRFEIIDVFNGPVGLVDVAFTAFGVSGAIPLSWLGASDGVVDFVTIVGTPMQPTDATNWVGTSVPAPGAAVALLGAAALGGRRRRRCVAEV